MFVSWPDERIYIEIYEYDPLDPGMGHGQIFYEADTVSMGIDKSINKMDSCKLNCQDLKSTDHNTHLRGTQPQRHPKPVSRIHPFWPLFHIMYHVYCIILIKYIH